MQHVLILVTQLRFGNVSHLVNLHDLILGSVFPSGTARLGSVSHLVLLHVLILVNGSHHGAQVHIETW